jgi:membrane protease YdiL (CAAX protease family)
MAILAWIVAPAIADRFDGPGAFAKALLVCLTGGLIWQFVLVVGLVASEQRTLRWSRVRDVLWLRAPRGPKTGHRSKKIWLIVPVLAVGFGLEEMLPGPSPVASHDFMSFLDSGAGHAMMSGAWGWFGLIAVLAVFNTVLGEELLFRGFLLPRMNGAFGDRDWLANGVMFAAYHLHMPWVIPAAMLDAFFLAYPSKRYRSALIGIAVHSVQSIVIVGVALSLVLA